MGLENHLGHLGSQGSKGHFTKKASSSTNCIALMQDLYICTSLSPFTKVMGLENHSESFGVTGFKRLFSPKKICNSSILHSITIRLIHVHQLKTFYYVVDQRSTGGYFES